MAVVKAWVMNGRQRQEGLKRDKKNPPKRGTDVYLPLFHCKNLQVMM